MTTTTTKQPYELLIRWNQDGQLAGAHVQYRYVIKEGEQIVSESVGLAESLALGGFPLADVLNTAQEAALVDNARLSAELGACREQR